MSLVGRGQPLSPYVEGGPDWVLLVRRFWLCGLFGFVGWVRFLGPTGVFVSEWGGIASGWWITGAKGTVGSFGSFPVRSATGNTRSCAWSTWLGSFTWFFVKVAEAARP